MIAERRLHPHQKQQQQQQQSFCFLFLLEHKRKVFECVRVKLPQGEEEVGQATVGDVLGSIPSYATEPALIAQRHCGLCSRNGSTDSDSDGVLMDETAKLSSYDFIDTGEILIAIPEGYNANQCRSMMKRILKKNPKIEKLLRRPDPLAPRSSRSAKGKKSTAKVSFPTAKLDAIIENDGDSKSEQSSASSSIDAIVSVSASASSGREDRVKRSNKEDQANNIKEFIAGKTNEVNSKREELEALIRHESARKLLEDEIQKKANARESIKAEIEERINGEVVVDKENNPTTNIIERMALEASELETSVMSDPRSPRHGEPTRQTSSLSSGLGIGSGTSLNATSVGRSKPNNTAFRSNNTETTLNERKPLSDKFRRIKRRLRRVKLTIKEKVSLGDNHHRCFPSLAFVVISSMLYHWYCPISMCFPLHKNIVLFVVLMLLAIVTREQQRNKKQQREWRELQNRSRTPTLSPRRKRTIRGVIRKQQ